MANMDVTSRTQYDRVELHDSHSRAGRDLTDRGRRILGFLTVVFALVAAALVYAAAKVFDGWSHAIVLGVLIVTFLAIASWVYSLRSKNPLQ